MGTLRGFTIDVEDLDRAVAFWGRLLRLQVRRREDPYVWFDEVSPGVALILQRVDDSKSSKNRMHLEVSSDDPAALISAIESWGGRRVQDVDQPAYALTVMADPDGNEFCVGRRLSTVLASSARMS
ncbi:MAG TPA: VOC family protein [Acidimicrobiia bacterium]|nr:VOC family protein [Acidimicrobiia bacterium]